MAPLLSVVVPAYGVGEYLPACLDSILASTLTDLEVIVVDDESPDESGEIADDYARVDSRVRVLHKKNEGVAKARNSGIELARGKYLAFVDSDDMIPPRAYELMVTTLEDTGSDIVAANAWRYIEGRGNVQSWTHAEPFAETLLRTHIREFPLLIRDRMMWNKVYRRSFWVEGGYEFPDMLYEDFPVALQAHLDARRVDVLSDKVYLWRSRLAEDSITQRALELDNLRDRVISAEMMLGYVETEPTGVRGGLHDYLTDVDIVTLATALHAAEEDERNAIRELAIRLARRLEPSSEAKPAARAIHAALQRGDDDAAVALIAWREKHDKRALLQALTSTSVLPSVPGMVLHRGGSGKKRPRLKGRTLKSHVLEISRPDDGGHHQVTVETRLRRMLLERADISATLSAGDVDKPLESSVAAFNGQRVTIEVLIPDDLVLDFDERAELRIHVKVGPMSWDDGVVIKRRDLLAPAVVGDQALVMAHAGPREWNLTLRTVPQASLVDLDFDEDALAVRVDPMHDFVGIVRPNPSPPLVAPVENGVARFPYEEILDDPADDPVTSLAYRDVVAFTKDEAESMVRVGESTRRLLAAATGVEDDADSGAADDSSPESDLAAESPEIREEGFEAEASQQLRRRGITPLIPLTLPEEPKRFGEHVIRVSRSRQGTAELSHQRADHAKG